MKQAFLIAGVLFILSCNNKPAKQTTTDENTGKKTESIAKLDTLPVGKRQYNFMTPAPPVVIPQTTAVSLHKSYLVYPIDNLVNSNNEKIRGFKIEKSDFDSVKKVATNGARIYFGYDSIAHQYRLMLVGLDADEANVVSVIADDFFPCPTYCPTGDPSGTETQRKKRFESDFNYLRTEGNEVIYMDFGKVEKRIRYK